jgi:hypothetical protein
MAIMGAGEYIEMFDCLTFEWWGIDVIGEVCSSLTLLSFLCGAVAVYFSVLFFAGLLLFSHYAVTLARLLCCAAKNASSFQLLDL